MENTLETSNWSSSTQVGKPGHCICAQVWEADGRPLATIEPTQDPIQASTIANLMAAAPSLLAALIQARDVIKDWHKLNESDDEAWSIYEKNAPEMQLINEAILKAKTLPERS